VPRLGNLVDEWQLLVRSGTSAKVLKTPSAHVQDDRGVPDHQQLDALPDDRPRREVLQSRLDPPKARLGVGMSKIDSDSCAIFRDNRHVGRSQ
jgi:hypothetical protein